VANEENLKPFGSGKLTESEERALQRKGGVNSGKTRSIKAREKEEWLELLSLPMKDGELDELKSLAGVKGANLTVSKQMKAVLIREVLKGNLRAYELLLRVIGIDEPEPKDPTENQANSFVDALNNTAAEVWANEAPEKE
jgi:hypothetical protein